MSSTTAEEKDSVKVLAQTEKAFQRQKGIFAGKKKVLAKKSKKGSKSLRWWRKVGLGFKTPKEAIEGNYVDDKCPFTGNVSIRGRVLKGVVISTKMKRTVIVRRNYLHYQAKYRRYEKRHKNVAAHCSPAFKDIKEGDVVTV